MKRSKFNLTHLHSTTGEAGFLIPFFLQSTLPGDRYRLSLTSFIRAQPMLAPLMHQVKFYTQYWFVPYRILWENWEEFITGGQDLTYAPDFPFVTSPAGGWKAGSLADYFGFPIEQEGIEVSAMPFRAMAEIWNTRYRDEDIQSEVNISYSDGKDTLTSTALLSPSWKRDYFTTARPFTQRGSDVSVPVYPSKSPTTYHRHGYTLSFEYWGTGYNQNPSVKIWADTTPPDGTGAPRYQSTNWQSIVRDRMPNGTASVIGHVCNALMVSGKLDDYYPTQTENKGSTLITFDGTGTNEPLLNFVATYSTEEGNHGQIYYTRVEVSNFPLTVHWRFTSDTVGTGASWQFSNITNEQKMSLLADSFNPGNYPNAFHQANRSILSDLPFYFQVSGQGIVQIRDLRASSALQRYAERSLQWGNRYEEFIQREFGIKPRDSRIQRPEYLGGGSGNLQISEVLQTAEGQDTGVGTMRGHAVAGVGQRPIKFTCPEHGLIIGLISIRPVPVYTQGIEREFLKRSRLDFFTPELANIGMQEVLQQELYATASNKDVIFGYSDRYQEYRYRKPMVTGQFRTDFAFWNMARQFSQPPTLNPDFLNMSKSSASFKRPFAVQSDATHSFLMMLRNNVRAWRPIPKRAKNILR
ncbi:major capsid protein [Chicken microvirus mg7_19]|nr:major capsid protein [Chicken microvirus mg7_19]